MGGGSLSSEEGFDSQFAGGAIQSKAVSSCLSLFAWGNESAAVVSAAYLLGLGTSSFWTIGSGRRSISSHRLEY